MSDTDIIDAELLPAVYEPPAPPTLFGTSDPRLALERMSDVASALADVIEKKNLFSVINGNKHVRVEGWTTLGGMLGIVPVVTGTRPNESGDGVIATVEARTLDGRVVGAAESECSRAESKWRNRDVFAIRGMAQTRAISRALRAPLGQIFVLAGYEPAGAEEISTDTRVQPPPAPPQSPGKIPADHRPTEQQRNELNSVITMLRQLAPGVDWAARCREITGAPWDMTTTTAAARLISQLQREWERLAGEGDE